MMWSSETVMYQELIEAAAEYDASCRGMTLHATSFHDDDTVHIVYRGAFGSIYKLSLPRPAINEIVSGHFCRTVYRKVGITQSEPEVS